MRNLKRALSLALAAVMVLGMMVIGAGAVSVDDFSDGADIVNKEAVTVLASLNVINGKDDGSYDPTGIVTRAEMAKMICVVLNGGRDPQLGSVVADSYTDTVSHWAKAYIEYCTNLGIVAGRGDGTFAPNDTVTMAEAAKMLLVAIGYNADIEGYVGANWQINTDVKANQEDLYEGITATNTSVDLTRDNAAQMVYNALECQMVKYEYVVTTDGSVVTTKPQVTTAGLGNVLEEKFNAVKVEAIVEGNEYATVNSLNYASSEDKGETYLNVVSISNSKQVNSSVPQDEEWKSADGIYDVATDKDLLGQRVVVYVRYKDTVGYDEKDALVIGDPIPVSSNKVVTSTDGTKVGDLADDNKLELTSDTTYLVNFGGYYGGTVYGGDPAGNSVATADKDNTPVAMTKAQFDLAAGCVGVTVTLIDNNGDKKVDYALAEKYSYGTINKYTTGDAAALRVQGFFNEGEYKAEDVVGFDNVALNDLVLFTEYGGKVYVQKPEQLEAKLDNYSTSKKNVTLDKETIKWSGLNGRVPAEVIWVGDYVTSEGVLNTTANYYKDNNGYIFAAGETDESLLTYAVLLGYENQTKSGTGLGTTARAKLLLADGTVGTYDIATIGGKSVTNCTSFVDSNSDGTPDTYVPTTGEVGFKLSDLYTIYSFSKNDAGAMRMVKKTEAHIDGTAGTGTTENVKFVNGTSNISYGNTETGLKAGSATVTERTIFLYERKDGTYSRYVGRTAPGIVTTAGAEVNLALGETFAIRVSKTGEALVVFMGNMDPVSEWKDNWAYVYNTKVAQNGDAYLVQAIIDGKPAEYLVEQAYDADGSTKLILPDVQSGIYKHTITVGLYNFTVDGNIYTLTKEHLSAGYNAETVIVDAFRSSYIRANNHSYTITDKTQMFEARKNKTAQAISSVNQGDQVTIVYNDDNEAVYIFLTEFSYNIINSNAAITTVNPSSPTSVTLDTKGGVVATVTTNSVNPDNRTYQWYNKTTGEKLVEGDKFTGTTTATLTAKDGIAADTYTVYCVVTNKDADGVTTSKESGVITLTVTPYTALTLNYNAAGDFVVATSKTSAALTETATITGGMVTIPADAASVVIKKTVAWTAGNYVKLGDKYYVVDADTTITVPVADLKALSDKNLSNASEVTSYAVTMPASGVTATWALGNVSGTVTDGSKVPQGATVTVAGLDGKYYVQTITGTYTKENSDFVMPGTAVDLAKKYVKVAAAVTVDEKGVLGWPKDTGSDPVKVTASVNGGEKYVEVGTGSVTVDLSLTGTITGGTQLTTAIKGTFGADNATIDNTAEKTVIDASSNNLHADVSSGVTLNVTANTGADVTITLTLTGGNA